MSAGVAAAVAALALSGGVALASSPHWSLVTSPNSGTLNNSLGAVSCVGSSFCMAAGDYYNGSYDQTLIEKWNRSSWKVVSSPNTSSTQANYLGEVSCVSSSFCMAAGAYYNGSYDQTLIEKWNGSSWKVVSSPNSSALWNDLYGVSCVGSSFCMAVGDYFNGLVYQTLIEKWNGSSWNVVSSPNSSTQGDNLNGVSCVSSGFCVAAGDYSNGTVDLTQIENWNGSDWSLVTSPNISSTDDNILYGVRCVSKSFCMAAGHDYNGTTDQTLIEKWNGSTWSLVTSPNTSSAEDNFIGAVSCVSSSFCMASGTYYNGSNDQTLIENWNGSTWKLVSSPNRSSTGDNALGGLSCVSSSFCMAAGYEVNGTTYQTLIEKW